MGFGDGFNKQYPGLENSGSTDIKVTGSLLVTGDLTVLGSSNLGGGGGGSGGYAVTGSTNIFRADQIISGNLDIDGTITAKQFNVVTSSVLYTSGSTKFGDSTDDTHQFTGSVISSVGFTGSLSGTASYATNAGSALTASYVTTGAIDQFQTGVRNQFSAGSNIGISDGVVSLSSSLQGLTAVTASYFTGSFLGSGAPLTNVTNLIHTKNIIWVNANSTESVENGTLLTPYKTIQAAHDQASSSYSDFSVPVVIDIAPGNYVESLNVTRHNTYFRSATGKNEQRNVKITGLITINCLAATQKSNEIVGFEGLFFQHGATDASTVTIQANGNHLTYFKDCYLYNTNGGLNSACLTVTNGNTFNNDKVVIQDCVFYGDAVSGWDGKLLNFAGGDIEINGAEIYTKGPEGQGYGIYISGNTIVSADRLLVDINVDQYAIYNASTILDARAKLLLSNASVSTSATSPLGTIYAGNICFLWNIALGGSAPKVSGNLSAPNPLSAAAYSSLTSITPGVSITFANVAQSPLIETHGTVIASALSGNLSASYIQGVIPVSKGGTGQNTFSGNSLLIASGTNAFVSLTGSVAADKYVVAWDATGSNFVLTASAGGGGLASVLTSGSITGSGVTGNEVRLKDDVGASTFTASVGFSGTLYGQATSALTASYINPLTQSVGIEGALSVSSGITGSFTGTIATSSVIQTFVTDVQNIAAATGVREISGSNNISITSGQYPTASLNSSIYLDNITLTNKITAVTGSFQLLETVSASSLMVGDKYIVIMSGASDHTTLNGSGILWGSGSSDATSYTDLSASAAILFNSGSDVLQAYPGLSSSFTGSFKGDGSQITNISAASLSGVVKTISATSPLTASANGNGAVTVTLNSSSLNFNGVTVALGSSGSIPLVKNLNASSSILISSSSLSGAVNIDLAKSLGGLTISGSTFSGSFSGSHIGDGSGLTGIVANSFNGTVLVNSGGTGLTSIPSGTLLVGNSATQLGTLSGSGPQLGHVAAWTANGFALQATGSGLPSGGGQGHVLIVSGTSYNWVAIDPSSSVAGRPFTFLHSSGGISLSQSSPISTRSGGLGDITQQSGALYVLDTSAARFIPLTGTLGQTLAYDGNRWNATDGFSRQVYTTASPALAISQIVALSGGLVAATAIDRLRANAFGVVQASSSAGYIVQTSGEAIIPFSSSNRNLLVTGSEIYVSSSGTGSLYEDISGNPSGRYATQIGYLNRISGSTHFIIISPRPFGLVY